MAYRPVRDEEGYERVRFEFDEQRGRIRHRGRDYSEREYQIEVKEGRYALRPVCYNERDQLIE